MEKFCIKIGQEHMQLQDIKELLEQTYWASAYSHETIKTAIAHSICFGVFYTPCQKQIAFARVLTDYATRFYIMDVVVHSDFRNSGIGNKLIESIMNYDSLKPLRGLLMTKDAKELYKKFGFEPYEITSMQKKR